MDAENHNNLELTGANVTLPKATIAELDRLARENQSSRSQLVRVAIQDYLRAGREKGSRPARQSGG